MIFCYDVETTGLKHWRHGVHQISFMIFDSDNSVLSSADYKVKPHPREAVDIEALSISGVTEKDLEGYSDREQVHQNIVGTLEKYVDRYDSSDKMFLMGYNSAGFDNDFLRAFFTRCGDEYFGSWFWADELDVRVLAANHFKDERHNMENFKLATVAEKCGIEVQEDRLHDAMYDLVLTKKIYDHVTNG